PAAGVVKEMRVKVGDKVSQGSAVLVLEATDAKAPADSKQQAAPADAPQAAAAGGMPKAPQPAKPAAETAPRAQPEERVPPPAQSAPPRAPVDEEGFGKAHASPAVRRLAREFGVDLAKVKGSGPK